MADELGHYANAQDVVVLALPRGGVPVGYEVAVQLNLPLEIFLVRKLGVPGHEEFAMGAIASGGIWFVNEAVVKQLRISRQDIQRIVEEERHEIERRMEKYGSTFIAHDLHGKTVLLIDDGLATGSTMRVAIQAVRQQQPKAIIVAVPVAPPSTIEDLTGSVDEVICLLRPESFNAVGQWYDDFTQTSDEEVTELLHLARSRFDSFLPVGLSALS